MFLWFDRAAGAKVYMLNKGPGGPYDGSNAGDGLTVHTAQVRGMQPHVGFSTAHAEQRTGCMFGTSHGVLCAAHASKRILVAVMQHGQARCTTSQLARLTIMCLSSVVNKYKHTGNRGCACSPACRQDVPPRASAA
jgi:hypothetical protein